MIELPISNIYIGERYRKEYGDLSGLKDSIKRVGLIHCIVLARSMEKTELVAGGRRIRALTELGFTKVFHGSTLNPERPGFVWEDEVPEHQRKEAELDENLYSLRTKWHEEVLQVADIHHLKKEVDMKWGYKQTATILGPGYGLSVVGNAIMLAKLIRRGDKEIIGCENMSDAIALVVKRKEDAALAEMQLRATPSRTSLTSFLDTLKIDLAGDGAAGAKDGRTMPPLTGSIPVAPTVPLSRMFVCGDFREVLPKLPNGSVDHIVTDIPYGIDMDNLDTMVNIKDVKHEHDVEQNVEQMEPFLKEAFRLVDTGGFCVFFYNLDWHEYLQATAEAIGWKVQRWPLIAYKTSACRNSAAQYNFTKNYESIMVLRRDESTVLRSQQPSSVWMGDFAAERRLYNNPFSKPFELWKWIYSAVAFTGQKVLDPFCGEMSACRAAINCGLVPFGVEINMRHFNRGLEHVKAAYALLHGTNVEFV